MKFHDQHQPLLGDPCRKQQAATVTDMLSNLYMSNLEYRYVVRNVIVSCLPIGFAAVPSVPLNAFASVCSFPSVMSGTLFFLRRGISAPAVYIFSGGLCTCSCLA